MDNTKELEKKLADKETELERLREKLRKAYQKLDEIIGDCEGMNGSQEEN